MMMSNILLVENSLDEIIPEPWCELNFNKDYELLIAVVLSAQTTDKRVNQVTEVLFKRYPDLKSLSEASSSDVESILRPLGSFKKKSQYVIGIALELVNNYDCKVPTDRKILESFPGVGRKTVSVFLSEYYDYPEFAVDTHVERVSKRLGLAFDRDNVLTVEKKLKKKFKKEEWSKRHKQMVLFGRYYCKAISPSCNECLFKDICKKKKV